MSDEKQFDGYVSLSPGNKFKDIGALAKISEDGSLEIYPHMLRGEDSIFLSHEETLCLAAYLMDALNIHSSD